MLCGVGGLRGRSARAVPPSPTVPPSRRDEVLHHLVELCKVLAQLKA